MNLDGLSRTVPGILSVASLPGRIVEYNAATSEFDLASTVGASVFVLNTSPLSTTADDRVPTGTTANMEVLESGRLTAAFVAATSVLQKETPLKLDSGELVIATLPADASLVLCYSNEEYTVGANAELVSVRWK
jgi:ABC-type amino acid transport substrate-binding protein